MVYSHITFGTLKTQLAARLGDAGEVYWTNAEKGLYITEALRVWGLCTGYYRDSGSFVTSSGTGVYDIKTLKNNINEALLSYTTTDSNITTLVQYHLLEPATGTSWTGSEQYTLTDVIGAIQRRRDLLLEETSAVITGDLNELAANSQTFDIQDTVLQLRNVRWTGVDGISWSVSPDDIGNQRNYGESYLLTPATPQTYSSSSQKQLRYIIAPPPSQPGFLQFLSVHSGPTVTSLGVSLGIPDDMAWIVKWGVMADMLGKEGPGQDLGRSYFCERRWKLGIALANIAPTVVNAQINGVSLSSEAISNLDEYNPNWYSTLGQPYLLGTMRNYIALAPCPNGIYSVLLDVVRKAIIPTLDDNFVQIGREYVDAILDYSEHLAAFKCGGMEFRHTLRGAENFFNAALGYNQRLAAQHPNIVELIQQSVSDDYVLPTKKPVDNQPLQTVSQMSQN